MRKFRSVLVGVATLALFAGMILPHVGAGQTAPAGEPRPCLRLFSGPLKRIANESNKVFALTNDGAPIKTAPCQVIVWRNIPLVPGVGYSPGPKAGQITFRVAPKPTDTLYAQGSY